MPKPEDINDADPIWASLNWYESALMAALINNYMPGNVWAEIT